MNKTLRYYIGQIKVQLDQNLSCISIWAVRAGLNVHTLNKNINTVIISVDDILIESVKVQVYPNPFNEETTIEVQGQKFDNLSLEVFDINGRKVSQVFGRGQEKLQLSRGDLLPGIYFYRLRGEGQLITTGKLSVQD